MNMRSAMKFFTSILTLNFIIALASMIYTLYIHQTSARATLGPEFTDSSRFDNETFDLETWACDLGRQLTKDRGYAQQCRIESVARWMVVVETVIALLVLIATIWALRKEKESI